MPFTTGLMGGLALTLSTLYITLQTHRANRIKQATLLHQQSMVLNNIVDPEPPSAPSREHVRHAGVLEMAKDRWNGEVEHLVRRVQGTDWPKVRENAEGVAAGVWRGITKKVEGKE